MTSDAWYDETPDEWFPVLHMVLPLLLMVHVNRVVVVLLAVYGWESTEELLYQVVGSYKFFTNVPDDAHETLANAVLLDPLQGLVGVLLAVGTMASWRWPMPPPREDLYTARPSHAWFAFTFLVLGGTTLLIEGRTASGVPWGYTVFAVAVAVFLVVHDAHPRLWCVTTTLVAVPPLLREVINVDLPVVLCTWVAVGVVAFGGTVVDHLHPRPPQPRSRSVSTKKRGDGYRAPEGW